MTQHDEFPAELVERLEWALAVHFSQNRQPCMSGDPRDRLSTQQRRNMDDAILAALRALRDAGALVPEGWVAVPRKPSDGLLMSMALRADHALGCPGYYDQPLLGGKAGQHAARLQVALSDAGRMYEEVVGAGFYRVEKDAEYRAMFAAAVEKEARDAG